MPVQRKNLPGGRNGDGDYAGRIKNSELVRTRQGQIMDAALDLFLEKGYGSTTIRDICASSGINQASIYDYVEGKEDILSKIFHRMHNPSDDNETRQEFSTAKATDLESYISNYLQFAWRENPKAILLVYREARRLPDADRREMLRRDAALVERIARDVAKFAGVRGDGERYRMVAETLVFFAAFLPFRQWHLKDMDIDTLVENVTRMVLAAVKDLQR